MGRAPSSSAAGAQAGAPATEASAARLRLGKIGTTWRSYSVAMPPGSPFPSGPVASVAEAIARMEAINAAMPASDGLACFNRMYLAVTDAASELATVPLAWRPLTERRDAPGIEPIQFALAGMNAHINHDLPL